MERLPSWQPGRPPTVWLCCVCAPCRSRADRRVGEDDFCRELHTGAVHGSDRFVAMQIGMDDVALFCPVRASRMAPTLDMVDTQYGTIIVSAISRMRTVDRSPCQSAYPSLIVISRWIGQIRRGYRATAA